MYPPKCPNCNSCLRATWVMPKRYWYCDLCLKWYDQEGSTKVLIEVPDPNKK